MLKLTGVLAMGVNTAVPPTAQALATWSMPLASATALATPALTALASAPIRTEPVLRKVA